MITAVLIDDEAAALQFLQWQLAQHCPQVRVLRLCGSAEEGIEAIAGERPQLVFLDIEMPGKNGFEVLAAFARPTFEVIFTTAYNEFAVKAFKYAAFDYLLKPIDADDLKEALARYEQKHGTVQEDALKKLMEHYLQAQNGGRIALSTPEGLMMLKADDIVRCQGISNYTRIVLAAGRQITVTRTLKEIEDILEGYSFFRVHKSHLINLNHVQRYLKQDGGTVVMSDGEELTVARNRKDALMLQFSRI